MKAITSASESFRVERALTFYGHGNQTLICEHEAYVSEGQTRFGEARVLNQDQLVSVLRSFSSAMEVVPRVMHPRVLVSAPALFAWWMPAGRRIHRFDVDWHKGVEGRDRLQGRTANLPHPALVFFQLGIDARTTHVFALERNERPSEDTKLFRAPFLNVNTDGWVCWGSTPLPKGNIATTFSQVEESFFVSTFSHLNNGAMVRAKDKGTYEFLADLCDNPPETYPTEVLIEHGSLQQVVTNMSRRG